MLASGSRCWRLALLSLALDADHSFAAGLTPAQRKELAAIRSAVTKIRVPVRREAIEDSEKKIGDAQQRLEALITESCAARRRPAFRQRHQVNRVPQRSDCQGAREVAAGRQEG